MKTVEVFFRWCPLLCLIIFDCEDSNGCTPLELEQFPGWHPMLSDWMISGHMVVSSNRGTPK